MVKVLKYPFNDSLLNAILVTIKINNTFIGIEKNKLKLSNKYKIEYIIPIVAPVHFFFIELLFFEIIAVQLIII